MVFQILIRRGTVAIVCYALGICSSQNSEIIQGSLCSFPVSQGSCSRPAGPLALGTDWSPDFPVFPFCCHSVLLAVLEPV